MSKWRRMDPLSEPLRRRVEAAVPEAIDDVTSAAAIFAKGHHPGWNNRTGTAEGSIRMEPATRAGSGRWRGAFGSFDVDYFLWLEIGARGRPGDHTLQRAADVEFRHLGARLRERLAA